MRALRPCLPTLVLGALALAACGDRVRGDARPSSPSPAATSAAVPVAGATASTAPPSPAGTSAVAPVAGGTTPTPSPSSASDPMPTPASPDKTPAPASRREVATFGAGCFWCVEAVLEQVPGVLDVQSGYMGGAVKNPTYEDVCSGETGHAEVVQVTFDPGLLTYEALLDWFWRLHDPTTLNRQGADVGTQYRSAIFWHSEAQRDAAVRSKQEAQAAFPSPIVTEITRAGPFYAAEAYHQDYYRANRTAGYCRVVIAPKLDKLRLKK